MNSNEEAFSEQHAKNEDESKSFIEIGEFPVFGLRRS